MPAALARELVALQPAPGSGIRLVRADDLHLTLHFIGRAAVAPALAALGKVGTHAFRLELDGPGHFGVRGRKRILWIGLRPEPALDALHAAVGAALRTTGFEPEPRRFVPHLTLARLGPEVPDAIVRQFERVSLPGAHAGFMCDRFALYASETPPAGPRYRILGNFSLG